jgi:Tfp pilus assembly protein PilN
MSDIAPKVEKAEPKMASIEDSTETTRARTTGPKFHMPEVGEKNSLLSGIVDLIPIAAKVRSWKQIGSLLAFGLVLSLVILGGLYGYLVLEQQKIVGNQNEQKQKITEIEKKILTFSELNKNINTLGQEIRLVQDTLNKHIYWTHFFSLLEKYTVNDVYYSGLAVGTNGGLTLSASTNSYDSVAKQLKVLNSEKAQEFVKEASITSAKQDKDGSVSFQIILSLNQDLFYYSQAN